LTGKILIFRGLVEGQFDCIKSELQDKLLKSCGAKTYVNVNYANKIAQKSSLHKVKKKWY
jgi:hypothetical protein